MGEIFQSVRNICDKEVLQLNLSFMALYIGIYESLADTVESRVGSFLSRDSYIDNKGKFRYKPSQTYIDEIKNRPVDDIGNRNILKATMLWFVENGAISSEDYETFLELKELRNSFAHEMGNYMFEGLREKHAKAMRQLMDLYRKIDKWWINEIEIPIAGEMTPGSYDPDDVTSLALQTFQLMIDVLYADKSEEYLQIVRDIEQKVQRE